MGHLVDCGRGPLMIATNLLALAQYLNPLQGMQRRFTRKRDTGKQKLLGSRTHNAPFN